MNVHEENNLKLSDYPFNSGKDDSDSEKKD